MDLITIPALFLLRQITFYSSISSSSLKIVDLHLPYNLLNIPVSTRYAETSRTSP